jgi:hypothetical protein
MQTNFEKVHRSTTGTYIDQLQESQDERTLHPNPLFPAIRDRRSLNA